MNLLIKLLDEFKYSAQRIETFPVYKVEGEWEEYERYINGIPEFDFGKNNWIQKIENVVQNNGKMERIRIVPHKINAYLRFETETGYVPNAVAGEKILVMPQKKYEMITPLELRGDFWIFDNSTVLKMNYAQNGEFLCSEIVQEKEFSLKIIELFHTLSNQGEELSHLIKIMRNIDEIYYE